MIVWLQQLAAPDTEEDLDNLDQLERADWVCYLLLSEPSSPAKSSPLLTYGEPLVKSSGITCVKHSQNLIGREQKR
jgi:hypothetical protein